jgi:hypothetical protein
MNRFRTSRRNPAAKARAEHDARMSAITTEQQPKHAGSDNTTWHVLKGGCVVGMVVKFDDDSDTTNPYKAFNRRSFMLGVFYDKRAFQRAVDAVANGI